MVLAGIVDEQHHLVGVIHVRRQSRCHEFSRPMRLQPRRVISDDGVSSGMGLVETILGKHRHQVEELFREGCAVAFLLRTR